MTKLRSLGLLSVAVACLAAPATLHASGSYCACMPKPPVTNAAGPVDKDRFDLGQKVFNGKIAPTQSDAALQRSRLEALQTQLPARVAKKKKLTNLAGKLTHEQLQALEYFIGRRYPQSK